MAISVVLPTALYPYAKGNGKVTLTESCTTVGQALAALAVRWPALVDRVLTEQGEIRRHVNVFVGEESVKFMEGLDTAVADGATITIVPAVSGG